MTFNRSKPYNELPDLQTVRGIETVAVLKRAISANKAIAELKASGYLIPNQAILVQALGLSEAKQSCEIENIVTTNDELYCAFADGATEVDAGTKEVLFYKDALWHGYRALKTKSQLLTTPLFEEISQILKNTTQTIRKNSGTKLANPFGEIVYTPPEGEGIIRNKLGALERFIYEENTIDPLIRMAMIHYQFEAIHPFDDGNGRTGRILNILFLIEKGLLELPILYLSRYIIANKTLYYNGLRSVTENSDWENWILYVLQGLEETATTARKKIVAIHQMSQETAEKIRMALPKIYSKDLVEVLFRSPYCKIRFLEEAGLGKRETSSKYLQQLENIGLLRSFKLGRDVYYINDPFLKLLTE